MLFDDMSSRQAQLDDAMRRFGASMVGFCDVSEFEPDVCKRYKTGIVIAVDIDREAVALLSRDDKAFHRAGQTARDRIYRIYGIACQLLRSWGFAAMPMKDSQLAEYHGGTRASVPFIDLGVLAGLGWLGKSGMLITSRYGPRVKLGVIITDCPLAKHKAPLESRCGECRECIDVCPVGAIGRTEPSPNATRDDMLDIALCNDWRSQSLAAIGRKSECALCIAVCPYAADSRQTNLSVVSVGAVSQSMSAAGESAQAGDFTADASVVELSDEEISFLTCDECDEDDLGVVDCDDMSDLAEDLADIEPSSDGVECLSSGLAARETGTGEADSSEHGSSQPYDYDVVEGEGLGRTAAESEELDSDVSDSGVSDVSEEERSADMSGGTGEDAVVETVLERSIEIESPVDFPTPLETADKAVVESGVLSGTAVLDAHPESTHGECDVADIDIKSDADVARPDSAASSSSMDDVSADRIADVGRTPSGVSSGVTDEATGDSVFDAPRVQRRSRNSWASSRRRSQGSVAGTNGVTGANGAAGANAAIGVGSMASAGSSPETTKAVPPTTAWNGSRTQQRTGKASPKPEPHDAHEPTSTPAPASASAPERQQRPQRPGRRPVKRETETAERKPPEA